jgi:hypothetical protein
VIGVRGDHRTMFDKPQRHELSTRFVEAVVNAYRDGAAGGTPDEGRQQRAA